MRWVPGILLILFTTITHITEDDQPVRVMRCPQGHYYHWGNQRHCSSRLWVLNDRRGTFQGRRESCKEVFDLFQPTTQ